MTDPTHSTDPQPQESAGLEAAQAEAAQAAPEADQAAQEADLLSPEQREAEQAKLAQIEPEQRDGGLPKKPEPEFAVVGLGASAGGLKPLQRFLEQMPPDSGMAYVVVMHLASEYESHLATVLQPLTSMPVLQVTDAIELEPNTVYVIPPDRNLQTIDSHLRLSPLERDHRSRAPIDHFFHALALSHDSLGIGVIFSGTGSDGALGLRHIKEAGGLTIAQDPFEAEYAAMPQSAIATGYVDLVLMVDAIPGKLLDYVHSQPNVPAPSDGEPLGDSMRSQLQKILTQVRALSGHDFSMYKHSTVLRRVRRRMQIQGIPDLAAYLDYLRKHDSEVRALFRDFLITVTSFFRDPKAYEALEKEVIPRLFQNKGPTDQVRVWVAGCASGEEAYSIAMLLLEHAGTLDYPPDLQVFASDLSEEALRRGREGIYPETIAEDVSPERMDRFFMLETGGYRIRHEVREIVLFSPHNLLKDPPFSRQDLISCRNLLIYLDRGVQRKLHELFHYALRPDGYLFLGSSEVVDGSVLFRDVNKRFGIYQRHSVSAEEVRMPTVPLALPARTGHADLAAGERRGAMSYSQVHKRMLERYGPPSLLVNADYNIVYYSEGASRYLFQPAGEPTNNVLKRVREELRVKLTTNLYSAFEKQEAALAEPTLMNIEGELRSVSFGIWPSADPNLTGLALIIFYESDPVESSVQPSESNRDATIAALEEELETIKRRYQATIGEYETSKEEMKAANEELQSMNEELRSTAEELETSKEELQSINEELITVNQENKSKVEELSQLTSDLQNLLVSTDIATLFLDRDFRIKRFTPRVAQLFNVLTSDRGRPLAHITHKLNYDRLFNDAEQVLRTLVPLEREVISEGGRTYLMRLLPYRTVDDRIDGVVITFVDLTERRQNP